jgi:predicted MFS family arabinose efflux permease
MALRSGADSALLYDAFAAADGSEHYPRAESRSQAVVALASGVTAMAGSLLATYDLRWPYVASVAASMVAVLAAAMLVEPRERRRRTSARLRDAVSVAARTPAVRWTLAVAALVVSASHVFYFLQQPYMAAAGVPIGLFGVVFAATKLVTAIVAGNAHRVEDRLGPTRTAAVMTVVPVLGLATMAAVRGPLGAVVIVSRGLLDGLWMPLVNVLMNRVVPSAMRATMLSLQSLVSRLVLAAVLAVVGVAAERLGLGATLACAACVVAVTGVALSVTAPRLPEPPRVIAE